MRYRANHGPDSGDRIKGNASGSLQIQYGTRSDLRMYGDVNIVQGNYNFSLQQIIHKDFKIRDGSTTISVAIPLMPIWISMRSTI